MNTQRQTLIMQEDPAVGVEGGAQQTCDLGLTR